MVAVMKSELAPPPEPPALAPPPTSSPTSAETPFDSLTRVRSHIPRELALPNTGRAMFYAFTGIAVMAAWLAASAWLFVAAMAQPLLILAWPVAWFVGGFVFTSWFVLGHDCGHMSFLRSKKLMVVLGHFFFLPGLYPYWAWKYSHDAHHQHTNNMSGGEGIYYDNAWIPLTELLYKKLAKTSTRLAWVYRVSRRCPPLGSWFHLALYHFKPQLFREGQHRRNVKLSIAVVIAALVVGTALLAVWTRSPLWTVVGLFHFWLIPSVLMQIWMSTYTFLHHTATDTKFFDAKEWTGFKGQMENTINVFFPRPVSFLHFNIDVHIPHHVLMTIPSYHLRQANDALKASEYGPMMRELPFTMGYYMKQVRECQLWDRKTKTYSSFSDRGI
jgi:omega-6 fatty acid desaturase (delta-12 desaturase)